jgi:hypothetical protein
MGFLPESELRARLEEISVEVTASGDSDLEVFPLVSIAPLFQDSAEEGGPGLRVLFLVAIGVTGVEGRATAPLYAL